MHVRDAVLLAASLTLFARDASAAPTWTADHEDNTLDAWDYKLFEKYISVAPNDYGGGQFAARIELHSDAEWQNGLRRVELHHTPEAALTAEGATIYFAWSFFLEETLPADPSQQIGYWETDQSYQQMMAFQVEGEHISFATRRPNNQVHWEADDAVTAGAWHRIAMKIRWSQDPDVGEVDVWFDGAQVVTAAKAQTLADQNRTFTQLGLLRGDEDFADMPVILIDDAVEGTTLDDVRPDLPSSGEGGAGATAASVAATTGNATGGVTTSQAQTTSTGGGTTSGGPGAGGAGGAEGDDGGCSVDPARGEPGTGLTVMLGLALTAAARARRRRHPRRAR